MVRKNKILTVNILIAFNRGILIFGIFSIESSGNITINELLNNIIFNRLSISYDFNIIF